MPYNSAVALGDDRRQRQLGERAMIFLGLVLFLAGFVWLWWHWVPVLYEGYNGITQAERLTAITNTRTALLAGLVGIGALGTFWLNSRVYRVTARTFDVTERGHQTERYSKAVEQMGSESIVERLGGIYALEQLATETANPRDRATVVQVISAFARVHSHDEDRPAEDVQAAITVLGHFPAEGDEVGPELSDSCFRGANFAHGSFRSAQFGSSDLKKALFLMADLDSANFLDANLWGARMGGAILTEANFWGADLTQADLTILRQYGKRMPEDAAKVGRAVFDGARLDDAILDDVDLSSVYGLTQEQVDVARGNEGTRLPPGLRHPESWVIHEATSGNGS